MNRRGFLKGLMAAVAVVAIEVKLSSGEPKAVDRNLTWAEANDRYDYGIDKSNPLDVAIYDKQEERMIDATALMERAYSRYDVAVAHTDSFMGTMSAFEATAIAAMSQGRLLERLDKAVIVAVPQFALDTIELRRHRDMSFDELGTPWLVTAPG